MGWGADALYDGTNIDYAPNAAELTAAFEAAAVEVGQTGEKRRRFSYHGRYSRFRGRLYMEEAIGRKAVGIFSPNEIREMAATPRWRDPTDLAPDFLSAYWSARKFLETCAKLGLGAYME